MFGAHVRIFVSVERVDLRVSFDRLAGIVRDQFHDDPKSGSLFVFLNKAADRCKVLFYERSGYALLYKRLDRGTFVAPPPAGGKTRVEINAQTFSRFLEGLTSEGGKLNSDYH